MNKNKLKADNAAIDGLVLSSEEQTAKFVDEVMSAARQASAPKTIPFPIFLRVCAVITVILSAGILIIRLANTEKFSNISSNSVKKTLTPCILATSPSGLIEHKGKVKNIVNGMSINSGDTIDLFKSSTAFIIFPNAAEITAGTGSKIHFQKTAASNSKDERLILERGAINADILKTKKGRSVSIKTKHGTFTTYDAEFILVCDKNFSYLEVKHGTVYAKNSQGDVIHVKRGSSEIISNKNLDNSLTQKIVLQHKIQLIIDIRQKDRLLNQLDKKRKIDICLRSFRRRKRHTS